MRQKSAIALFAAGLVVLAVGWFFGPHSAALTRGTVARGTLMFPGLTQRLQDAAKLEITSKGHTLALDRTDDVWGVAERGGYPAQSQKVRALLTGLTELRLDEPRTADPAFFSRLGLADPTKPDNAGNLVRVLDKDGKTIAAVIVGHSQTRSPGSLAGVTHETVYVRAPEQDQTWLAAGHVDAEADPLLWLQRDIMSFPPDKIARVEIAPAAPASGTAPPRLVFTVKDGKLTVTEPTDHPPLDDSKVEAITHALDTVSLEDVRRADGAPAGQAQAVSTFDIAGGPTIAATIDKDDGAYWVRFGVSGKDADDLARRVQGWDYKLPAWKAQALMPTLDSLKAPVPPPEAAPAQSTPAPSIPLPPAPAPTVRTTRPR